jgi:hypothetical protein
MCQPIGLLFEWRSEVLLKWLGFWRPTWEIAAAWPRCDWLDSCFFSALNVRECTSFDWSIRWIRFFFLGTIHNFLMKHWWPDTHPACWIVCLSWRSNFRFQLLWLLIYQLMVPVFSEVSEAGAVSCRLLNRCVWLYYDCCSLVARIVHATSLLWNFE